MSAVDTAVGSPLARWWGAMTGLSPSWWLSIAAVAVPILAVVIGPVLWTVEPSAQDLADRLASPSAAHPLGTDALGRDVLARVLSGGRVSIGVGLIVTVLVTILGVLLGSLASAWSGRWPDQLFLRFVSLVMAFPFMLAALTIAGLWGGGLRGIVVALVAFAWETHAVVARAELIKARGLPYVTAARGFGVRPLTIYFRHLLPSALPSLIAVTVFRFSTVILAVASLSFLGVGVSPPQAEWGSMVSEGAPYFEQAPLLLIGPGVAVTLTCLAVSLLGERIRRSINPIDQSGR